MKIFIVLASLMLLACATTTQAKSPLYETCQKIKDSPVVPEVLPVLEAGANVGVAFCDKFTDPAQKAICVLLITAGVDVIKSCIVPEAASPRALCRHYDCVFAERQRTPVQIE